MTRWLPPLALVCVLLVGCSHDPAPEPAPPTAPSTPVPAPAFDPSLEPAQAVLSFVPRSAEVLTVTDWDRVRVQLGQPDLTSKDPRTDRTAFWDRAADEAVLLTAGLLRDDASLLELDYGFTQDDVDWEARFAGEAGPGFVLGLRPDLDLAGVRRAIADGAGPLAGAELVARHHLVVSGVADVDVWATDDRWDGLVDEPAAGTYLRAGCLTPADVLGPDTDAEERAALLAEHPVEALEELAGFVVAFGDHQATVRTGPDRGDLFERMRLGEAWQREEFTRTWVHAAADPSTGRIGYTLRDPSVAAGQTLLEELPFALCDEPAPPLPEPTGL